MIPERERLVQLARLVGSDAFAGRLGPPETAAPDAAALRSLVDERFDQVVTHLVEEAAASDDVLDGGSALAYLEDRLRTLTDLVSEEQAGRIRAAFGERTAQW